MEEEISTGIVTRSRARQNPAASEALEHTTSPSIRAKSAADREEESHEVATKPGSSETPTKTPRKRPISVSTPDVSASGRRSRRGQAGVTTPVKTPQLKHGMSAGTSEAIATLRSSRRAVSEDTGANIVEDSKRKTSGSVSPSNALQVPVSLPAKQAESESLGKNQSTPSWSTGSSKQSRETNGSVGQLSSSGLSTDKSPSVAEFKECMAEQAPISPVEVNENTAKEANNADRVEIPETPQDGNLSKQQLQATPNSSEAKESSASKRSLRSTPHRVDPVVSGTDSDLEYFAAEKRQSKQILLGKISAYIDLNDSTISDSNEAGQNASLKDSEEPGKHLEAIASMKTPNKSHGSSAELFGQRTPASKSVTFDDSVQEGSNKLVFPKTPVTWPMARDLEESDASGENESLMHSLDKGEDDDPATNKLPPLAHISANSGLGDFSVQSLASVFDEKPGDSSSDSLDKMLRSGNLNVHGPKDSYKRDFHKAFGKEDESKSSQSYEKPPGMASSGFETEKNYKEFRSQSLSVKLNPPKDNGATFSKSWCHGAVSNSKPRENANDENPKDMWFSEENSKQQESLQRNQFEDAGEAMDEGDEKSFERSESTGDEEAASIDSFIDSEEQTGEHASDSDSEDIPFGKDAAARLYFNEEEGNNQENRSTKKGAITTSIVSATNKTDDRHSKQDSVDGQVMPGPGTRHETEHKKTPAENKRPISPEVKTGQIDSEEKKRLAELSDEMLQDFRRKTFGSYEAVGLVSTQGTSRCSLPSNTKGEASNFQPSDSFMEDVQKIKSAGERKHSVKVIHRSAESSDIGIEMEDEVRSTFLLNGANNQATGNRRPYKGFVARDVAQAAPVGMVHQIDSDEEHRLAEIGENPVHMDRCHRTMSPVQVDGDCVEDRRSLSHLCGPTKADFEPSRYFLGDVNKIRSANTSNPLETEFTDHADEDVVDPDECYAASSQQSSESEAAVEQKGDRRRLSRSFSEFDAGNRNQAKAEQASSDPNNSFNYSLEYCEKAEEKKKSRKTRKKAKRTQEETRQAVIHALRASVRVLFGDERPWCAAANESCSIADSSDEENGDRAVREMRGAIHKPIPLRTRADASNQRTNRAKISTKKPSADQAIQQFRSLAGQIVEVPTSPHLSKARQYFRIVGGMLCVEPVTPPDVGSGLKRALSREDAQPDSRRSKRARMMIGEPAETFPRQHWTQSGLFLEEPLSDISD